MNRLVRTIAAATLAVAIGVLGGIAPAMAAAPVPKVALIVGPVGDLTPTYIALANQAAKAAQAAGAQVVTVYSPNATWPLVRDALQGASLVVYLGHGNGWPSRYRTSPAPKTQNGLGLNPEAGVDDKAHQYFGEAYLARDVRLAPHAVVLLLHLCYASGNSEPGLPEGDLATAQQRVDNFAAGWLAAGAEAVLAEGHGGPAYYVSRILAGDGTIESIWREAPTAHGHVLAFPSVRTPGMTALMDPDYEASGFYRSLVARAQLRAGEVARGAAGVDSRGGDATASPSASAGPTVTDVTIDGVPTVGSPLRITLKLDKAGEKPARDLGIGIRWDPLSLDPPPVIPESTGVAADAEPTPTPASGQTRASTPAATPTPSPTPTPTPAPTSTPSPTPTPTLSGTTRAVAADGVEPPASREAVAAAEVGTPAAPTPAPPVPQAAVVDVGEPAAAPSIALISPEVPGAVVSLSDVSVKKSSISADVVTPLEPGLYRLAVSLHDGDGVAFDATTQERIEALIVRVTGELSAVVSATARLSAAAGAEVDLPVAVANTGHLAWVSAEPPTSVVGPVPDGLDDAWQSALVGRWMSLDGSVVAPDAIAARTVIQAPPGATDYVLLALRAPSEPGTYLLVLDVVSPLYGSLTAVGGSPMIVRVDVMSPGTGDAFDGGYPGASGGLRPPR